MFKTKLLNKRYTARSQIHLSSLKSSLVTPLLFPRESKNTTTIGAVAWIQSSAPHGYSNLISNCLCQSRFCMFSVIDPSPIVRVYFKIIPSIAYDSTTYLLHRQTHVSYVFGHIHRNVNGHNVGVFLPDCLNCRRRIYYAICMSNNALLQ